MPWNKLPLRLLTLGLALLMTGLLGCPRQSKQEQPDLIILQTGRLRGNVFPHGIGVQPTIPYFAYIGGYVEQVRREAAASGAEVVLVDLGDSLGGSFSSYTTGHANMVAFFNELNYDAVALGNLDADIPPEIISQLNMPVLTPFAAQDGQPLPPNATFHTSLQSKLGTLVLLANFLDSTPKSEQPEKFPTRFAGTDEVFPLRDYSRQIATIPDWEQAALRLLMLMKFEPGSESAKQFVNQMLDLGVNCIIAHRIYSSKLQEGWSQDDLDDYPQAVNMNIMRRNSGFSVARTDLKRNANSWQLLRRELVPMTSNTANFDNRLVQAINAEFGDKIMRADRTVATLEKPVEEPALLEAVLQVFEQADPQAAQFYSLASIRTSLKPGDLPLSLLYDAVPWLEPVVSLEITPEELEQLRAEESFTLRMPTTSSTTSPTRLITTEFFANLLEQQFGIAGSRQIIEEKPLFLLLADLITSKDGALTATDNQPASLE